MYLGIQSWDKTIREKLFHRYLSNDTMEKAIKTILDAKIELITENLIGLPGQKVQDMIDSNMIYTKIRPTRAAFYMLRFYPNHSITLKGKKEGWMSEDFFNAVQDGKDYERFVIKSFFTTQDGHEKELLERVSFVPLLSGLD